MPLLSLYLKYNNSERSKVVLSGAIPKQPLRLVHYNIALAAADNNVDTLLVQLPFLNNFDVNSNFDVNDSIPIFNNPDSRQTSSIMDLEFNPARNIDEVMDWKVYKDDGTQYTSQNYTITLLFSYRRSDLI